MLGKLPLIGVVFSIAAANALSRPPASSPQSDAQQTGRLDSTLVALDRRLWEAVRTKDTLSFVRGTASGWLDVNDTGFGRPSPADIAGAIRSCETPAYQIDSATVMRVNPDAAVLTYRVRLEQVCNGERQPTPQYVTGVWARQGGSWKLATLVFTPVRQGTR